MKSAITPLLFAFMLSCTIQSKAQSTASSLENIRNGINLYEEKKYDESIAELKKVHRNDSNYYLANVEILLSYMALHQDSLGLELCNHLLKLRNDYTPNILIYKADFLDNLKRSAEAEKIYQQGIREYPTNHSFYYEMGVVKMREMKYQEAYDFFIKALKINPMHASSHYQLWLMAHRQNNIVGTMLAYQFYFLTDRNSTRAKNLVVFLENVAKMESEPDTVITVKNFENDFSELESIIKSKVAFSGKYKVKVDLNYDLVKQMQLLIENIGKYSDVKGFYNDFYGKFFAELQKEKYFEPYVYTSLSGLGIEKVNNWTEKNKKDVSKFERWAYNYICNNMATYPENLNGQTVSVPHWFSSNKITAAGLVKDDVSEGYWNYYYDNGIKKSEGSFKKGQKDGVWKYYYKSGGIKEVQEFDNGLQKKSISYYMNNNPRVEYNVANNMLNGDVKTYFSNGNPRVVTYYKDGKVSGKETQYYRNASLNYSIDNTDGILNGALTEYFDNGKVRQKCVFVNSKVNGDFKLFYNNDNNTIESEGLYAMGKLTGEWKYYHKNGKIMQQGSYNKDGEKEGPWKEWTDEGKVLSEENYTEGKLNGLQKYYDYDGNLWQEYVYRKGKMNEYRAYKKDGSTVGDYKIKGKNFQLVLYHASGQKRREGKVSDGEMDGVWKDYSFYGVLEKETSYTEGKLDGPFREYYADGKVKTERTFINGTENGDYKTYFINGKTKTEGKVVDGKNEGYWKYYYIDGSIEKIAYYYNDEIDGWYEYYDVNGKLFQEDLYSEGCLVKIVYHDTLGRVMQNVDLPGGTGTIDKKTPSGSLFFHKEFVKDFPENKTLTYFPDGKVRSEANYKKGKLEGKYQVYDEFGRLNSEWPYFNNEVDGKHFEYYENGKVKSEFTYDNGEEQGKAVLYYENGKTYRDFIYKKGLAQGESNMYDEQGQLIYRRVFFNDLLVNYTYKDAAGNFMKPLELAPGQSKVLCYFQNGKKSIESDYFNGDLNGKRIVYNSNGSVFSESNFYYEKEHGESKYYHPNGKLKSTEVYLYGVLHGPVKTYHENGTVKMERSYKLGEEHGWAKFYDDKGKLIKAVLYYNGEPIAMK